MLEPIVAFFDKLIEEFSWRRLGFLLVFLIVVLTATWGYESYTSAFRLTRIERQVELLDKLADVGTKEEVRTQTELQKIYRELQRDNPKERSWRVCSAIQRPRA